MKYALLIYADAAALEELPEEERATVSRQYLEVTQDPQVVGGEQLQAAEMATTVRVGDGQTLTTDGPFVDTREFLGGFYLLEADNLDRAIEVAARIPATWMRGAVEIRPIVERPS